MIVKNEEHIIERGLRSCLSQMDTFCIVDTGSTDKTKEIIQKVSDELGVKGYIYDRPWVNFGHNRSEALELARKHMTWAFMLDADDILEGIIDRELLKEDIGGYTIQINESSMMNHRTSLTNLKYNWKYKGAVHEYPYSTETSNIQHLPNTVFIKSQREGSRSNDAQKYLKDALMLQKEYESNPDCDKGRTLFYLAQSYRDAGIKDMAIKYYDLRSESEGWIEENYVSFLNLIRLTDYIDEKLDYAWLAQEVCPYRKECIYEILQYARKKDIFQQEIYALGYTFFNNIPNKNSLFIEEFAYGWNYFDEFGLQAFYTKHYMEALQSFAIAIKLCPEEHKERTQKNIELSLQNLPPMPKADIQQKEEVLEDFDTDLLEFEVLEINNKTTANVINLNRRTDRWKKMQELYKDSKTIKLKRFSAIEHTNGHIGCGRSIQENIKYAINNKLDTILIFEDDNQPLENYDERWNICKEWLDNNLDKWDIFYGSINLEENLNCKTSFFIELNPDCKLYKPSKHLDTNWIYINKSAYSRILDWTFEKYHAIDRYLCDSKYFNNIVIFPVLSIQYPSVSDTQGVGKIYDYVSDTQGVGKIYDYVFKLFNNSIIDNFVFYNENNILIDKNKEEFIEQRQVKQYLNPNSVVLELGARYGTISCIINKIINNPKNQVSVEPDNRVIEALKNNMKNNNCNFHIIEGFISKKKLDLINKDNYYGYGTTSIKSNKTTIKSYTLEEIEELYNLNFDTLIADCEGFLEEFFDENPKMYKQLKCVIMEHDYPEKCNYVKIMHNLKLNGFVEIEHDTHSVPRTVWKKNQPQ